MSANTMAMRNAMDAVVRDFKSLDLNNLAAAGRPVKVVGIMLMCIAIAFGGYWFIIRGEVRQYAKLQTKEQSLKQLYLQKKALAVNLPAYQLQMKQMKQMFNVMLQQLPNRNQVPDLLVDITQAGLGRGLKFVLFKPNPEKPVDFYDELPISLTVKGTYHELGEFVSDLAALPRIVTVDHINVQSTAKGGNVLTMSAVAKTYRYRKGGGK
ncbi:MAG: type IV pilus inner membrane component PilO [Acidiferrobacteraceae bacterium]